MKWKFFSRTILTITEAKACRFEKRILRTEIINKTEGLLSNDNLKNSENHGTFSRNPRAGSPLILAP